MDHTTTRIATPAETPLSAPAEMTDEKTIGHHGYTAHKQGYLRRLRRIEGQARGLQRMVEDDRYCIDILTQISAMTRALQSVSLGLLEEHLDHCVRGAVTSGDDATAKAKLEEASAAIARLVRS